MPARAPSPAISENGFDITGNLLGDDSDNDSVDADVPKSAPKQTKKLSKDVPAGGVGSEDSADDDLFIAKAQVGANRKTTNLAGKSVKKGGGFQAMGLNAKLRQAITKKGFSVPTPIQRKAIPQIQAGKDVVGMARTGSGKTAAFVIPMIDKLKEHSTAVGVRALILSPTRELALQTLKVVKEFSRGTDLRCVLQVGGDSLEQGFKDMASNPDIVIAAPGRFNHLVFEMGLDISSIKYVVFDEADRLWEQGLEEDLNTICKELPPSRQTLLFSATMPAKMESFTEARLHDPVLIRLDTEQKISPDLQSAFFSVKSSEKEGALLHILQDLIKIPTGFTEAVQKAQEAKFKNQKKRKRETGRVNFNQSPTEHSTMIFAATSHHVEYLVALLREFGFATSYYYGLLNQLAREEQVRDFTTGLTHIMVATDVAARGIDIPVLANVINYDFPDQPKVFVHRVGRTARAGQRGWSYNILQESDAPYLLDLQLFLSKRFLVGRQGVGVANYTEDITLGSLPRDRVSDHSEWVTKQLDENIETLAKKNVSIKGQKRRDQRDRRAASGSSVQRGKELVTSQAWMELHPLFDNETTKLEFERQKMLARVSGFRPQETIFEIGKRGAAGEAAEVAKKLRKSIEAKRRKLEATKGQDEGDDLDDMEATGEDQALPASFDSDSDEEQAPFEDNDDDDDDEMEVTVTESAPSKKKSKTGRDDSVYMGYKPTTTNEHEEQGYDVRSGSGKSSYLTEARSAVMDFGQEEMGKGFGESGAAGKRWDKRHKKYVSVANDTDGSKGKRMITTESGAKIAASLKSGRFEAWKKSNRIERLPRNGEQESKGDFNASSSGRRYKHKTDKAPRAPDKARDDYHKQKKKFDAAKERNPGGFDGGKSRGEVKGARDVQKDRVAKAKRKEKTSRPSKKMKR